VNAPNDTDINGDIYYYITYIDRAKIRLEEPTGKEILLTLTDGEWDNESIESIAIKSHAAETGYARQNNLMNGVWVDIYFNGDLPITLTGQITNLEEDKIEVTTFPENEVIFIDFAYRGLPEDLPIDKIQIRKAPDGSLQKKPQEVLNIEERGLALGEQALGEQALEERGLEEVPPIDSLERKYNELRQQWLEIPEEERTDTNLEYERQKEIQDQTRNYIFNADQIQFGEDLDVITQLVDVPEEEQRYDIDKQLDDLLDDMLSTIPSAQRTETVKNNVHKMIQRFKQLRENFSIFDAKGYALMPKARGPAYKPLVSVVEKFEKQLYWMLPVVKTKKKIYTDDQASDEEDENVDQGAEDVESISFAENYKAEKAVVAKYEENEETLGEGTKYSLFQKALQPYLTPFMEPAESADIIVNAPVHTTITAIVDNLGDFNSSVNGNDTFTSPHSANKYERKRKTHRTRFALQTYTTGASGLDIIKVRGDTPIVKRKELTRNDELALKSMATLPAATVRFSRINLQTPSILDKSNLNMHFLNYWQLLRTKMHVAQTIIKAPYQHDPDTFLKKMHNYTPVEQTYTHFLEAIIPKTKFLFHQIKPYLVGNLSIPDILTYMEPFMIYQDDLNVQHYKEMNVFLQEKINEYRKKYAARAREYASIKGTQGVFIPSLLKILEENTSLRTKVLDVYGFSETIMSMSNADFLKRIYEIDGGVFYNNAIALISTHLMIADGSRDMADIDIYLNKERTVAEDKTKKTAKTAAKTTTTAASGDCSKIKVIAKRYIESDELNEDNGREIFFDKKYDTTHYDIGERFKVDALLPIPAQIQHYMEKLMKNKGMSELNARRDAEAIVKGKRTVESGEYAILETTDETSATIQYYVRQNETWVLDATIDAETFADNLKMFCNLNEKCITVKEKCEDQTSGANQLKKHNLNLLLAEFNTALNVNKDMITNRIEDELTRADARIDILRNLRLSKRYVYDTKKIELGHTVEATQAAVISPYDGLLNSITERRQTNIAKYYSDIANFVKAFTRAGLAENAESHYWLYCTKSGKKMLPTFIAQLATTFLTGGNFGQTLDKICALQGTLSEDGDKYVDKYSGYTIKMIEMSADEEYNEEGFKIITRAVLESDAGDVLLQNDASDLLLQPEVKRKYATPDATAIYNVIETLSKNMGINLEDHKDFIVANVLKQLSNANVMPPKAAYAKSFALMASKGKTIDTYEIAYNAALLYLTFAYYLIAIQLSTPPIKTKTTFPGCKQSFGGFPLEDTDSNNMAGLTYVACVAFKIKNKAALPWAAIANRADKFIAKQMEGYITRFILPTEEVQNGIKQLKLYRTENPESAFIPPDHTIETWSNFLPPLKPLKMQSTQDLGDVFKTRLSDSLRKGKKDQDDYMGEVHSKILLFSFHIIALIEKTVAGEQALLKGKNGVPFVENACCEIGENNTIKYFIKNEPEIAVFNAKVVRLSGLYDDAKKLSKAVILYDPSNTKRKLREIENKFSEQTIYRAFIVYCKFNSLVPLSDNLKAICPAKPENFEVNDSLEESIRKLKSNARNYGEQSLQQLLEIINTSTKSFIKQEEKEVSNIQKLTEIMDRMDAEHKGSTVFRDDFMKVLGTFELNTLSEDTPEMYRLKNLLAKVNTAMVTQITTFIGNYKNPKGAEFKKFKECLETIVQFKETGNNLILGKKEETGYKMIQFMKKTMRALTREFPNIIMNAVKYEKVNVPKHWELSAIHEKNVKEFIKEHYSEFTPFYKDAQIRLLMEKMIGLTSELNELAQNTLCYAPVELPTKKRHTESDKEKEKESDKEKEKEEKYSTFDLDLTTLLFKFYFFSVLADLIGLQKNKEILTQPLTQLGEEEESFMTKANEQEILFGNQAELGEKIAALIVAFTNVICSDKSVIDQNYKGLMELLLRSKEREKKEITDYLGAMTVEERRVEDLFKNNKLGRWSKGQQKGNYTYVAGTYDEEVAKMEEMTRSDIAAADAEAAEAADEAADKEDNMITYMGEDAEPEEYEMDGDENY
jgi:hypothetical protein